LQVLFLIKRETFLVEKSLTLAPLTRKAAVNWLSISSCAS
jgi:hypothetical protein